MTMTTRARWVLLPACLLMGCSSLSNLFSADGEQTGADAGPTTLLPTGQAPDAASAVSIPEQPAPRVEVEAPAIKAVVSSLSAALTGRNVETATAQFTSEVRTRYRTMFASATPEQLDLLAAALVQLNVTTVVAGSVSETELRGEAVVLLDGRTFHVGLVKRDNQWRLASL